MTRLTTTTDVRKSTCLAFCIAAILSAPAFADGTTATAAVTPTDSAATSAPQTQNAQNLSAVQVTGTTTASAVAPTQGSTIATQPQSIIGDLYLRENVAATGDYTDAISISPSVYTIAPNGPGLMEASEVSMRGFQDGQYNVTFDGIP